MKIILSFVLQVCVVIAAPVLDTDNEAKWCKGKPADIFFLLDSSSSIWIKYYRNQLNFVSEVIESFEISRDKTRVGVGIFSNHFSKEIDFEDFDNKTDLQNAVRNIRYMKGNTYTHKALKSVNELFKHARKEVAHITIVLTDGKSRNKRLTLKEAERLHEAGVYVFAIGIGKKVDLEELQAIGSGEEFVFKVAHFNFLDKIRETLAMQACKVEIVTEPPMDQPFCVAQSPADVMFLLDSPGMGVRKSQAIYNFISEISDEIVSDQAMIQVGVMSKNCHDNDIRLKKYFEKQELISRIRNFEFRGLEHQVHRMRSEEFVLNNDLRPEARKIAVLFIDDNTLKYDSLILESEHAKLKSKYEIFVVAIGDNVDLEACGRIASSQRNHVIKVSSYKDLRILKDDFLFSFCQSL